MSSIPLVAGDFQRGTSPNRTSGLPVEDKAHARNAKARASQAANASRMSKAKERKIDKKADAILNKR
jgi:hypothetical protein